MTIRIFARDDTGPPYDMVIELRCDGPHGLFPAQPVQWPIGADEFPRDPAYRAGWRFGENGEHFCPVCR